MIFTESIVKLETSYADPRFYSTTITDAEGGFTNAHCLILYERITPSLVEQSFGWRAKNKDYDLKFVKNTVNEKELYVPVVLCIMSKSTYVDVFRDILMIIFTSLLQSAQVNDQIHGSIECLNTLLYLANESIIPPFDTELHIKVQNKTLKLPIESYYKLRHNESCVSLVFDLIDTKSIIRFWEAALLNKHLFVISSNNYLLFTVLEAMKILIFPLRWDLNIIPVLNPSLSDYMGSVPPIMIGINSEYVEKYQLFAKDKEYVVLNLDTGTFTYPDKANAGLQSGLCDCKFQLLYNKLQLIRNYQKHSKEKVFDLGLNSLEDLVPDKVFVSLARNLLTCSESEEKEEVFNSLVQQVFFGFFEQIINFEQFMDEMNGGEVMFITEKFIEQIKTCGPECKMKDFWKNLIDGSMTFQIFLDKFNKIDQSDLKRFRNIVKGKKSLPARKVVLESGIDDQEFILKYKEFVDQVQVSSLNEKFQLKIIKQIFEDLLISEEKEKKDSIKGFAYMPEATEKINIFYGEYGVLRVNKVFLAFLNKELINKLYSQCSLRILANVSWEQVAISLNVELKESMLDWDIEKIMTLLFRLNCLNTKAIPNHYTAILIEKMNLKDNSILEKLQLCKGHLRKIVRLFLQPNYSVRTVSISSRKDINFKLGSN